MPAPWIVALVAAALPATAAADAELPWIVDAPTAADLVTRGALVLDARAEQARRRVPIGNAVAATWQEFSLPDGPTRGELLPTRELTPRLRSLGIRADVPIVVVGDPGNDWGEDGRIVWMLRTLGHRCVAWVDGGAAALRDAGVRRARAPPGAGDFVVRRTGRWAIARDGVRRRFANRAAVIVDTRTRREFDGATPYGERRGGHLPGAVHLHFRDLLGENGRLLPEPALRARLADRGIGPDREVIVYCTGGVRAAWLVAVLVHLGYPAVRNYAGSMWDWADGPADRFPLVR